MAMLGEAQATSALGEGVEAIRDITKWVCLCGAFLATGPVALQALPAR